MKQESWMRVLLSLVVIPALLLFPALSAFPMNASDQLVMYRLKDEKIKEFRDYFSPDEKVCAEYTFLPEQAETVVEFRWFNPYNKRVKREIEIVKLTQPPKKKTVLSWIYLQSHMLDKLVGYRNFGVWRLEVWISNRRVSQMKFNVGN
jgi:hypothetical protein